MNIPQSWKKYFLLQKSFYFQRIFKENLSWLKRTTPVMILNSGCNEPEEQQLCSANRPLL